jgi:site-specific DNA-adenine methylase
MSTRPHCRPAVKRFPTPLKCHGGKGNHRGALAKWIISRMPPHHTYVEPFAGGLAVLLYKTRSPCEGAGDLDGRRMAFWRAIQDPATFAEFTRRVKEVRVHKGDFDRARHHAYGGADLVADALAFFTCSRMSRGGGGRHFSVSPNRLRRGREETLSS